MRLYIPSPQTKAYASFCHGSFARHMPGTSLGRLQSFYDLIKQGEEYMRALGTVQGQYRYFRQGCLHKCRHRRGCRSRTAMKGGRTTLRTGKTSAGKGKTGRSMRSAARANST